MRTLIIDNYDSFTYNLYQLIAGVNGEEPVVVRNDDETFRIEALSDYDNVVISPGPGRPDRPSDFGICKEVILACDRPLLGVCLGHQGLCYLYGGEVSPAPEVRHGRLSPVLHEGTDLFAGVPSPFSVVRYHSLTVTRLPEDLEPIARTPDGILMAVRHRRRPAWGVQFHPESIGTEYGRQILQNFAELTWKWQKDGRLDRRAPRHPGMKQSPARASARDPHRRMRVLSRKLSARVSAEGVFENLYRGSRHAFWLDSNRPDSALDRFSFMGDASGPAARVVKADVWEGRITIEARGRTESVNGAFFDWLDADLRSWQVEVPDLPFDFALGWVGYLGYELKSECGGNRAHRSENPDATMIFADRAIVFDHEEGTVYLLALAPLDEEGLSMQWIRDTEVRLGSLAALPTEALPQPTAPRLDGGLALRHDRERYLRLIGSCQEAIQAGESYEICLTNRVTGRGAVEPWSAYRWLRQASPAPFAAFLRLGPLSILSSSPERFLHVSRDRLAESKPMKGTRPRSALPLEDERLRLELASNGKERAENLMIVDLVRNDLGTCAEVGSVHVPKLFDVESYATVHQLVSTIRARLRPDSSAVRCVQAAFPGGSMTGAPKIRTMRISDELEAGPRGVYSGALGYFSLSGAADLSITIRTLVVTPDRVSFGVGGAITALSDPDAEFEETAVKATALVRLLQSSFPGAAPSPARWGAGMGSSDGAKAQSGRGDVLVWKSGGLVPHAREEGELLAADSWLVADARVRGLDWHRQRFLGACAERVRLSEDHLDSFWQAVVGALPRHGRWFPRVELSANDHALLLRLRPAPPQGAAVRVWVGNGADPRATPRRKGPDLSRLAEVRRRASLAGADDALLTTNSGVVLESASSSVLWWEGSCLCRPSPDLGVLPGVTARLLEQLAARLGVPVEYRSRRLRELDGCEVWLVNALHGIRPVSRWVDAPVVPGPAILAPSWQARLQECATRLPEHG